MLLTVVLFVCVWVTLAATGDMSGLQICSPTVSLPQVVKTVSSPSPQHSSQKLPEEVSSKRELRMIKNRYVNINHLINGSFHSEKQIKCNT